MAGDNAITPAVLKAHKGHKVELKITNTAPDKAHGFSIDGYNVVKTVDMGKTETISFTANKSRTYRVFCQLHPTHQAAQLIVT